MLSLPPRSIIITKDYGKTWNKISFKELYNNICRPPEVKNSWWLYVLDYNSLISWDYLQEDERYNFFENYKKDKINFFSIKYLIKIVILLRVKIYLFIKNLTKKNETSSKNSFSSSF